ncbi:Zinc finger BED domain-containing protein RICESLEEPER 2 [Linum perenne]
MSAEMSSNIPISPVVDSTNVTPTTTNQAIDTDQTDVERPYAKKARLESVNAVETFKYNQTKMREVVCHWIILEEQPLCTADSDMFTYMLKHGNPLYQRISRASVTTDLFSTYDIFKCKLQATLANVRRVNLTTHMWKSNQTIGYMVVTYHFVNEYWRLQNCLLDFCVVSPPHSGLVISDELHKCLVNWNLEKKVWIITVDNATSNDVAMRTLKEFRAKNNENPTEHVHETTSATSIANVQFKVLRGKAAFDSTVQKQVSAPAGKSELDKYLESHIFEDPKGSEFDVIGWWKEHSLQYKILSRMAIDILAIPITSVASKAAFSAGGRLTGSVLRATAVFVRISW